MSLLSYFTRRSDGRAEPVNHARELALIGAQKRSKARRERLASTTRELCRLTGQAVPEAFQEGQA